ncbi:hypothetical protein ABEB36_011680 [Hypothenemus hampei]|uniref:Uncharacterized protein n=1 Tax=Hypothenemus hampei TaxID=57062 RepID=A0ABD1ED04_HYPHA
MSHELKKMREKPSGAGSDELSEPVWWFHRMEFLIPHLRHQKEKDSIRSTEEETEVKLNKHANTGIIDFEKTSDVTSNISFTSRSEHFTKKVRISHIPKHWKH